MLLYSIQDKEGSEQIQDICRVSGAAEIGGERWKDMLRQGYKSNR
jgi:hypothetical protein